MVQSHVLRSSIRARTIALSTFWIICGYYGHEVYQSYQSEPKLKHFNTSSFTPYTLVSKEAVSNSSSIFRLRPQHRDPATLQAVRDAQAKGIWSVQFKQPQLQIARNYTPLPDPGGALDEDEFQLLIKREEGGEVSNYLHDLPERSTIFVRGPFEELAFPADVTDILFLAGGTGIAPALQVADLLKGKTDVRMHILWANRRRDECEGGMSDSSVSTDRKRGSWFGQIRGKLHNTRPDGVCQRGQVVQLLQSLKAKGGSGYLTIDYFVDEEEKFISTKDVAAVLSGEEGPAKALILIAGPDGFVEYWAGRKKWAGGRETQGVLGGQLARMDRKGWSVIKI